MFFFLKPWTSYSSIERLISLSFKESSSWNFFCLSNTLFLFFVYFVLPYLFLGDCVPNPSFYFILTIWSSIFSALLLVKDWLLSEGTLETCFDWCFEGCFDRSFICYGSDSRGVCLPTISCSIILKYWPIMRLGRWMKSSF